MRIVEPDALALEYQRDYGTARWNDNLADLMNNSVPQSVCRIFGPGFSKEVIDFGLGNARTLLNDRPDTLLVGQDTL